MKCFIDYNSLFDNVQKSKNVKYVSKSRYLSRPEIATQLLDIYKRPFSKFNETQGIHNENRDVFTAAIATSASGVGKTFFGTHRIAEMTDIIQNETEIYPKALVDMFLKENRIIDIHLDFNGGGDKITDNSKNIIGSRLFTNGILGVKYNNKTYHGLLPINDELFKVQSVIQSIFKMHRNQYNISDNEIVGLSIFICDSIRNSNDL